MPSRRTLVLILWLSALLLGGWRLAATLRPQADLSLFLPPGQGETERLLLSELNQGSASRLLMLAIAGAEAEGRADLSQRLVAELRDSDLFERVENGAPGSFAVDDQLFRYRYLLTPPERLQLSLTEAGLRQALKRRLSELSSPLPDPFASLLPKDPTGAYAGLLQRWRPQTEIPRTAGVWASPEGERALLLAVTREGGLALERQARAVALIQQRFGELDKAGAYRLTLSGPGAFGVFSQQRIEAESQQLSLFASLAIALLLLLAYRHLPYLLYAALPLASGLLVATLVTAALFDTLHGITLAFGVTLLGVTLDYPVHLFSHLTPGEAPVATLRRIWPTLRLGVITTCLGYFVLVTTDFTGLRQLGVYTLAGLLSAALASRYLLPLLLGGQTPPSPQGGAWLQRLNRRRGLPALLLAAACGLSALSLFGDHSLWNDDVAVLSPLPASLLEEDRQLRRQLMTDESGRLILLQGETLEQLLQRCEALRPQLDRVVAEGLTGGATLPCDLLPSVARQEAIRLAIPPAGEMRRRLSQALDGLPFRPGAFDGFLDDLEASRRLPQLTYERLSEESPLKAALEPLLRAGRSDWLALSPLRQIEDAEALAARLDALPGVLSVDLRQQTSRLIGGFRQAILRQLGLGALVMFAVLWIGLRSPKRSLAVLIPIAAALLITLALLQWRGEAMNLFHLISLMLVLGIGIDFSLFFQREAAGDEPDGRTLHALTLCALSTVGVFAILGSSEIPVLHAIGQTVAFGVALSYLATYAFWHRPRKPRPEAAA